MTGQKEAEEISWDGGQPAPTSPSTRQHEQQQQHTQRTARKQGRLVETWGGMQHQR